MEYIDTGRSGCREWGNIIKKCMWAFDWIRMFKALIGKLTKFQKRRIENIMYVDWSNSVTVEEELAWGLGYPIPAQSRDPCVFSQIV